MPNLQGSYEAVIHRFTGTLVRACRIAVALDDAVVGVYRAVTDKQGEWT